MHFILGPKEGPVCLVGISTSYVEEKFGFGAGLGLIFR